MLKKVYEVKSVIFDMDGVITDTMPYHFKAWKFVFKKVGIDVTYEDVYKREGQRGSKALKEIFLEHNIKYDINKAQELLRQKEVLFNKIVRVKYVKGSRDFIRKLKKKSFKLGLVTGTSRSEFYKILPSKFRKLFKVIITGSDVKFGKPYPQPYKKCLKKLKITCEDAIVVENAPLGILSAKKAGLRCLSLETSLPRKYLKKSDAIFKDFKTLNRKIDFKLKVS